MVEEHEPDSQYGFKAIENIIVLCSSLGNFEKMLAYQSKILDKIDKVARNDMADAINNILDAISRDLDNQPHHQEKMYSMTLTML